MKYEYVALKVADDDKELLESEVKKFGFEIADWEEETIERFGSIEQFWLCRIRARISPRWSKLQAFAKLWDERNMYIETCKVSTIIDNIEKEEWS